MLTPKRWAILRAMTGQGGLALREIARRAGRDVQAVNGDVQALLAAGLLDRDEAGRIRLSDAGVHVRFDFVGA